MKKLFAGMFALLFLVPAAQAENDLYRYLVLRYQLRQAFSPSASSSRSSMTDEQRAAKTRKSCIESFDISKKSWKGLKESRGNFQSVVHMKEKFETSDIENAPVHPDYQVSRYGSDHKYFRGLANKKFLQVAWTTSMSIPHSRPGCNELWEVGDVQVVTWKDKTCRRVEFVFEQRSYHTMMCGDDQDIYLDYSGDLSESAMIKSERACDGSLEK